MEDKEKKHEGKNETEKHEEEKKEEKPINTKKNYDKQFKIVLIAIFFVILAFIGAYYYFQSLNKFTDSGLDWEKIRYGQLDLYHARFPVANGNFYNLYFHTDPRKNKIPVNALYTLRNKIIVSISSDAASCYGASLPMAELSEFLVVMGAKINITFIEKNRAEEIKRIPTNCSDSLNQTVILIQKSAAPEILQDTEYPECYKINVGDCKNLEATEKFISSVMEQINQKKIENN
jgi:hypothetical protein